MRKAPSSRDDRTALNYFRHIGTNEVREFEEETSTHMPEAYMEFLREVGAGRLRQDRLGLVSYDYENTFLEPSDISRILRRESEHWEVYPDFIANGEIPFFDLGNNSVLVFRKGRGDGVNFPFLDDVIATSFAEFLAILMENVNFFRAA